MPLPDLTKPLILMRPRKTPHGPFRPKGGKIRKAEEVIAALLSGRSLKLAAQDCGLGYRTLKTWLSSEWFRAEYAAAKKCLLDTTVNHLRTVSGQAVATLYDVAVDATNPPAARAGAARAILEVLFRAVETQEILERLARLEELTKGDNKL
ncbi:MAG TPA: hypothetical protein VIJ65_00240 [Acidobacteriaceae bacterium]